LFVLIIVLLIALIVLFAQFGSNYHTQVKVMRRFFKNKGTAPENYLELTSVITDVDYMSVLSNGILDIYTANDAIAPQPVLLWVHGGGYVGGDKSCIKSWAHVIAAELKIAVASVNYCLAPDQHYPGPIVQVGEALRFLTDNATRFNLDPTRIFLGGDSAGAQIASQYAALIHNDSLKKTMKIFPPVSDEQLRGVILCCGFYNMDNVLKSRFPAIKTFMWAYTNNKKLKTFARKNELSTAKNLENGYCDVFITCGDADPFLEQAKEFIADLEAANITADAYLPKVKGKKLGHEYQFLVGTTEADIALDKAVTFIEKRL